jgi:membrane protease YdiL (CAAX protease family)
MYKKICRYLIAAFAITYLFWGLDIVLSCLGLYEHPAYNVGIVFYVIAACAPMASVFILWQKEDGNFLKTIFRFQNPLLELSLLLAFLLIRFGIPFLFGDVRITGGIWQVLIFIPVMFLFGGFEEVGWRGYLQPVLEEKCGFIIATLINWAIWVVWHIPLCFIKGTYQYSGSYLWFAISLLGSAFSAAALHRVKGSIIPCILFHATGNAIVSYGLSIGDGTGAIVSYAAQIIFAILIACLCKRTSSHR